MLISMPSSPSSFSSSITVGMTVVSSPGLLSGHMACILLTDMARPGSPPQAYQEPAAAKQEEDAACLVVHLYNRAKGSGCSAKGSEDALSFPPGVFAAEELCISAARACGESRGWWWWWFWWGSLTISPHSQLCWSTWRKGCCMLPRRMSQIPKYFAVRWRCTRQLKDLTKHFTHASFQDFFSCIRETPARTWKHTRVASRFHVFIK